MQIYRAPVVVPVSAPPIRDGGVAVEEGRIVAVAPINELPSSDTIEYDGILTPGLINSHTHLCYSAYADHYSNGKAFFEWIQDFAIRNATMDDAAWRDSTQQGINASLSHGVTGIADVVTPPAALEVLAKSNMAGNLYFEACFMDGIEWAKHRDQYISIIDAVEHTSDLAMGISPHTLYTLAKSVGSELGELARERGWRLHPHLAETLDEDHYVRAGIGPFADISRQLGAQFELLDGGSGRSPAIEMDEWGLLGADSHVAHGVHLDANDRARLRHHGTHVALCPRSNARLEAGEPPVAAHRAEENPIAVGTDSLASTPDLDVLAELPELRRIARNQGDNGDGLDQWLFHAATRGGAQALGRNDLGIIQPGARADLAVFAIDNPGNDIYSALVTDGPGACVDTILAGTRVK